MAEIVPLRALEELPEFPLETLPAAARDYCQFLREGGLPLEYLGPTALGFMSTAIGGLTRLQIGDSYWDEPLMLWTLTVGVTGSGKSPAVKNLRRAVDGIESPWRQQYREQLEDWESLPAKERKLQPQPRAKRMVVGDITYEKLARLLAEPQNGAGLVLIADEFTSFVKGLGQYKQSGGSDRGNFLTVWTAQPVPYDRVKDNVSLFAERPIVNIVAGTQPHLLSALTGDDGFRDRFLVSIYDKPVSDQVPDLVQAHGEEGRWRLLIERLADTRDRVRTRFLSDDARQAWKKLRSQYIAIQNDPDTPHHLVGWTAKAPSHLARLALLLSEAEGRGDVDVDTLSRAALLVKYFGAHYRRLPLDEPNPMLPRHRQGEDQAVRAIADYCRRCPQHLATQRQLRRARVGGMRTTTEVELAIKRYEDTYPSHVFSQTPPGGGREQTVVYAPGHSPDPEAD